MIRAIYNANNGYLADPHKQGFAISNNFVYLDNNLRFFGIPYGQSIGDNGLVDYNYSK